MRIVADLHVHSKYARATSQQNDVPGLSEGAKVKGIDLMATGDFTHPAYFEELKSVLKDGEGGLYDFKGTKFILSTEISLIYSGTPKVRKMHHIVLAPSLEIAAQINEQLSKRGNLASDGRPIIGMSSAALADELFSISKDIMIIPAHVWTPWFAIFGSKSGVDTVEEAFGEHARHIHALETGLSSDPAMNWMLSSLDKYTLVSNSDAHSLAKLGREANVFELEKLTYKTLTDAIKTRKGFVKTYEFYPEEGKYHYDGHRKCNVLLTPWEAKARNNICPECRKPLTIGVLHRVADLADRKQGFKPENAVPFDYIVPLTTVISKTIRKGETTNAVNEEYWKLIKYFGNEFSVFEAPNDQLRLATTPAISESIIRVKEGRIKWVPGYDGVFGSLVLDDTTSKNAVDKKQTSLEDY